MKTYWLDCPLCSVRMVRSRQYQLGFKCPTCESLFFPTITGSKAKVEFVKSMMAWNSKHVNPLKHLKQRK